MHRPQTSASTAAGCYLRKKYCHSRKARSIRTYRSNGFGLPLIGVGAIGWPRHQWGSSTGIVSGFLGWLWSRGWRSLSRGLLGIFCIRGKSGFLRRPLAGRKRRCKCPWSADDAACTMRVFRKCTALGFWRCLRGGGASATRVSLLFEGGIFLAWYSALRIVFLRALWHSRCRGSPRGLGAPVAWTRLSGGFFP